MKRISQPPELPWTIREPDVATVKRFFEGERYAADVCERRKRNVDQPAPEFSREQFWYVLMGCLLTTRQRSTKGSRVHTFLEGSDFPLTLDACNKEPVVGEFVQRAIKEFGGIRMGPTIGGRANENLRRLNEALWADTEQWFARLYAQRTREPQASDKALEREAAQWADASFAGIGPKQSRNLWQWLGLSRYETPLDSRVTDWINDNFSIEVDADRLGSSRYYEAVLDYVQALCEKAGVLPCEFDAAAFDFEDLGRTGRVTRSTTQTGFINSNGQITIRNTGTPGTDHNQFVYQIACSRCGHVYGANGSDIHERKCPACQEGRPGLPS
jgi:hypothetical protein